jgi:ABC-type cobalt transport system substrate-binding protein
MTSLSLRPLIILMLVLTILAGSAVAQSTGEDARAEQDTAQQASMSETQRQDVLLRKMILMGFPAAAVGGLIIALVVTRKKGRERRQQAQQNRN